MLENAGAFNPENQNNTNTLWFLKREGKGGGSFDFSTQHIPYHKWKQDVDFDNVPIGNETDVLFYVKSQKTAHNHFNFGNFLFGAGGQALGVDLEVLLYGANENSLKGDSNGYGGQPDSKDDQLSIYYGYIYAEKKKFNQIHIDPKGSSGGNNNQKKSDETR